MPTPPRESIGGTKPKQIADFNFHKAQFEYISDIETYTQSQDFSDLTEEEKTIINSNLRNQNIAYEELREIVDSY